jgi:RNA polymerase sigma-70 factor, ECF subfamily
VPGADAATVERAYRESSGRAVATLARVFGDIDIAEDAVQEAFAVAAQRWPATGVPPNPGGWIVTTARNKALDCRPVPKRRRWNRCPMTACG